MDPEAIQLFIQNVIYIHAQLVPLGAPQSVSFICFSAATVHCMNRPRDQTLFFFFFVVDKMCYLTSESPQNIKNIVKYIIVHCSTILLDRNLFISAKTPMLVGVHIGMCLS